MNKKIIIKKVPKGNSNKMSRKKEKCDDCGKTKIFKNEAIEIKMVEYELEKAGKSNIIEIIDNDERYNYIFSIQRKMELYPICKEIKHKRDSVLVITGDMIESRKVTEEEIKKIRNEIKAVARLVPVIKISGKIETDKTKDNKTDYASKLTEGLDNVYYLKKRGFYRFNNFVFGVTGINDNEILETNKMKGQREGDTFIALCHASTVERIQNS